MKIPRTAWLAILVAWAAAIAGLWVGSRGNDSGPASDPLAVQALTKSSFKDLSGQTRTLESLSGSVRVINFWATWCPPCREEMPTFSKIAAKYADKGVNFVGIALDDLPKVQAFSRDTPVSYPLWLADVSAISLTVPLGNSTQALPFTAILDRQGKLILTRLGRLSEGELEAVLEPLLPK